MPVIARHPTTSTGACCAESQMLPVQVDAGCVPNAQAARDACRQLVSRLHGATAAPTGVSGSGRDKDEFRMLNSARAHLQCTHALCAVQTNSGPPDVVARRQCCTDD